MELSETAINMLKSGKGYNLSKDRDAIIANLKKNGVPIYDKVVDFEVKYGGISYKHDATHGLTFGLVDYKDVFEINGEYYFECAYYNCSNPVNILIDKNGYIYEYHTDNDGKSTLYKIANCIEELIEEDAKTFSGISPDLWVEVACSSSKEEAEKFFRKWKKKNRTWFEKLSLENDVRIDTILASDKKCLTRYMVKRK